MTDKEARNLLPDVNVLIDGEIRQCRTAGRLNKFATVYQTDTGTSWEFSWEAVARAISKGYILNI